MQNLDDPADIRNPWRLALPNDPLEVGAAIHATLGIAPGPLRLVAQKHIGAYSAWLWADADGNAFFSKKPKGASAFVWATGADVAAVLRKNPSLHVVMSTDRNLR
ncbi:hypothetical protein M0Q28_06160 [Patescibacteria group bacterium]|jgi:hypothetical protein|nr:hypothetical protein [Patescibacteria group bacterium]